METSGWLTVFVAVTAMAFLLQLGVMVMMYVQFRQLNQRLTSVSDDLRNKVTPILTRLQFIMEDSQGRIASIVADAAEVSHIARGQAVRVDRVLSEGVDRLRLQIIRADQILSGALETVEEAGLQVRRTFLGPVQKASAFVRGLQVGIEVLRSGRRPAQETAREPQDEGLFI